MSKSTGKAHPIPKLKRGKQSPGRTPKTREQLLISLSYDLVEKRLRQGTATSQETTHFLKVGSSLAELEKVKLEHENKLLEAKTEMVKSQKKVEELYANAVAAFKSYHGDQGDESDD